MLHRFLDPCKISCLHPHLGFVGFTGLGSGVLNGFRVLARDCRSRGLEFGDYSPR